MADTRIVDSFDYMRKSRAIFRGDNEIAERGNLWEQIPAGEQYRPDRILEAKEELCTDQSDDNQPYSTECTIHQRIECGKDALKLLRNRFKSDREFLIWVARFLLQLKLEEMEEIFRLHSSNLCRVSNKADRRLYKNNTEGKAKIKSPRETT